MPDDRIPISELEEALTLDDNAQIPYVQNNGGTYTTYKALLTQIASKIVEDMTYAGITLPVSAGVKSVENTLNYLIDAIGGDPNANITDEYDPTTAYVKGDLCIYENALYICTAPTTGTFDPSKWTATTIDNVIGNLSTLTTTDKSSLVGAVNEVVSAKDISSELSMNVANFTASTKTVYCTGNVVNICLRGALTATNATAIGSITSKYKPKCERIICELHDNLAPMPITTGAVWINGQNGSLYYFGSSVTSKDVCLTVSYIANIY